MFKKNTISRLLQDRLRFFLPFSYIHVLHVNLQLFTYLIEKGLNFLLFFIIYASKKESGLKKQSKKMSLWALGNSHEHFCTIF